MKLIVSFIAGLLFAVGLALGGMTDPSKVIGFLNFFGGWDPTMMFVMGGAVLTYGVIFRFTLRKPKPIFNSTFSVPQMTQLTPRLIVGSAIFGVGWGLSGLCPGPALTSLTSAPIAVGFVVAMFFGMSFANLVVRSKENCEQKVWVCMGRRAKALFA